METEDLRSVLSSVFIAITSMNREVQWLTRPGDINMNSEVQWLTRPGDMVDRMAY